MFVSKGYEQSKRKSVERFERKKLPACNTSCYNRWACDEPHAARPVRFVTLERYPGTLIQKVAHRMTFSAAHETPTHRVQRLVALLCLTAALALAVPAGTAAASDAAGSPAPEPSASPSPSADPSPSPSATPTEGTEDAAPQLAESQSAEPSLFAAAASDDGIYVAANNKIARGSSVTARIETSPGVNATAYLWYRSNTTWVRNSTPIDISNGDGQHTWRPAASNSYRVEVEGVGMSNIFSVAVTDSGGRAVRAEFGADDFVVGETTWVRGIVTDSGHAMAGAIVTIQRARVGTTGWASVGKARTTSTGIYAMRTIPSTEYVYRVKLNGTSAISPTVSIDRSTGDRTLEDRAEQLSWLVGSPLSGVRVISSSDLPGDVDAARYRVYSRVTLIEVDSGSTTRTWLAYDRIGDRYKDLDRMQGALGLPMRDPKCAQLEGGCVQRFRGGAIYQNESSMSPGAYVAYGTVVETEIVAAARSQTGFEERTWRKNKYNSWINGSEAWCAVFTAWAASASGNGNMVPATKSYASYVQVLQNSGHLRYSGTPPVGAAVLFDWGTGNPSHSGLVMSHPGGGNLRTVEGNTTDGSGDPQRGVYERTRPISGVWAWYWPHEYGN
jgi:hypothetical protein